MSEVVKSEIKVEAIRQELERILASPVFRNARRSQAFLRHVVEASLQGHAPKEYEIAVDVLERGADYDPAFDATVRVEAGRLRTRLREYYQICGSQIPSGSQIRCVGIEIPKGSYIAIFTECDSREAEAPAPRFASPRTLAESAGAAETPSALVSNPASSMAAGRGHAQRAKLWIRILLGFGLLASLAFWLIWLIRDHPRGPGLIRSVAVLPLQNLSGDPNQEYFADGMTDELITELAKIPTLRVVSRTSIMQEKGTKKSLGQIAHELGVDAIVEGSVMRSEGRVRITAQLIDGRSDRHLWAQSFEGQLGDVLSLQDNVAREIAYGTRAVTHPATSEQLPNAQHIAPEAHDAFLRGRYFVERREGTLAAKYFEAAIKLDPTYASAYAGLAEALSTQSEAEGARPSDVMPSAIAAARRAIELDPEDGEAYTASGAIETEYLWEWKAAENDLKRGIVLSPSSALAEIRYAIFLDDVNRTEEAVVHMRRAVELDPLSFWANRHLGTTLFYDRKYDEAIAVLDRSAEIAPDKPALVAGWKDAIFEAREQYDRSVTGELSAMARDHSAEELRSLRFGYDSGGWRGYQRARLELLLSHRQGRYDRNEIAFSYLRIGELDNAFRWFAREADEHGIWVLTFKADPRFDGVRKDPRYLALLRRIGLSE